METKATAAMDTSKHHGNPPGGNVWKGKHSNTTDQYRTGS